MDPPTPQTQDPWTQPPTRTFKFPDANHPEQGHTDCVYSIQLAGRYLISASKDRSIRIWDVDTQQRVRLIDNAHEGSVLSVWYIEDTDTIVSGGTDTTIAIWRFSTGEPIERIVKAHEESILNVRGDNRYIVTASKDKTVRVWDGKDYKLKWIAYGHIAAVNSVRLSKDYVVSGSGDRTIKIWNVESGSLVRSIQGHDKGIASLEILGNAAGIVSGSSDLTLKVWDGSDGSELKQLKGHQELVRAVALRVHDADSQDNEKNNEFGLEMIVSGSYDGTALLWKRDANGQWCVRNRLVVKDAIHDLGKDTTTESTDIISRIFAIQIDDHRVICCSQVAGIVGWDFGSSQ
jgi:F-box and WD-40 domain protein 1/11